MMIFGKSHLFFVQFWSFIDIRFYTTQLIVFAWSTIERHILIFHDRCLLRIKKRFFLYYFPLIIFYPFCEYFNYQLAINGVFIPCNSIFAKLDLIFHQIIPTFIIIIFSIGLFLRILWQKIRLNRSIQWRRQRKLTLQVLSISILYLLFQFSWAFFQFCNLVGLPVDSIRNAVLYTYFFGYYVGFLFPFVCCGSLLELRKKVIGNICLSLVSNFHRDNNST